MSGGVLSALVAALSNAVETISDKLILRGKGCSGRAVMVYQMTAISVITMIPALLFGQIQAGFWQPLMLMNFIGILACAVIFNNFYFFAVSGDDLCDIEPILVLSLPFTALLGSFFFPKQSSVLLVVLTFIAFLALVVTRVEKHHYKPTKYTAAMIGFVIFISTESILIQNILPYINPIALYSVRTLCLATIFLIFFRPKEKVSSKTLGHISLIGVVVAIEYFSRYFAYEQIGVVRSSLIFLLGPILILLYSTFFLKEKLTTKRAIGDIIVVGCVVTSLLIR